MKKFLKDVLYQDIVYIICNYIIAYIPVWTVRKLLYKLFGMKIGTGSRIAMRCIIMRPRKIIIGNNSIINEFVLLDGRGGLRIGDNNSISMYAKLYTGTHKTYSETFEYIGLPTKLKDNCWVGTSAIIMPGSILNDFTVIGANSLFKGETQEKSIYVGVPAILQKERKIDKKYILEYISFFR